MRIKAALSFLLIFTSLFVSSQNYSTRGEIYDYEVGDIFHFEEDEFWTYGWLDRVINIEIIEKSVSSNFDTITYKKFVETYTTTTGGGPQGYDSFYEYRVVVNPDLLFIVDSVYYSNNYNARKISYIDDSYGLVDIYYRYVDGCGLANYLFRDMNGPPYEFGTAMVYFKKGDEEWGTPNPIVGIHDLNDAKKSIKIFPNPARDIIHLSATDFIIAEVHIYDHLGRLVQLVSNNFKTIDISAFQSGLYVVEVMWDGHRIRKKLIVQ